MVLEDSSANITIIFVFSLSIAILAILSVLIKKLWDFMRSKCLLGVKILKNDIALQLDRNEMFVI